MIDIYVGLGSNLGDRDANIRAAIGTLSDHDMVDLVAISQFYETNAVATSCTLMRLLNSTPF